MKKNSLYKPTVLAVLDGWGQIPGWSGNAISSAHPKHFDYYWRNYPHLILHSFSQIVPAGRLVTDPGIGYAMLGTGRIIFPIFQRISNQIKSGEFFQNQILAAIANDTLNSNSNLHLIGVISPANILSDFSHLQALMIFFKNRGVKNLLIHGILDGLDATPNSGIGVIDLLEQQISQQNLGAIVSLIGRSWILDNEPNSKNLSPTINTLTSLNSPTANSAIEAVKQTYQQRISDALFPPTIIISADPENSRIKPSDSVIFFNFQGDNLKQLIDKLSSLNCQKLYSLTDYQNSHTKAIFLEPQITNSLPEIISANNLKQLTIAESFNKKKVEFYFKGLKNIKLPGESKSIIEEDEDFNPEKNPQLKLYDLTKTAMEKIKNGDFDFISIDLANAEKVAYTGNILACEKAVSYLDEALASIVEQTLKKLGCVIVCADHGLVEDMNRLLSFEGNKKNFNTRNPVPFIYISPDNKIDRPQILQTVDQGSFISQVVTDKFTIADVAPTILELLGLTKPAEITGKSLLAVLK